MKNLIDIHSHILPSVDDGADSYETSVKMLRLAAEDGISGVILTPHNKPGHRHMHLSEIAAKADKLRAMMAAESIEVDLYTGSELYYRSGLTEEMKDGLAGTLAGSRYVLVEFNPLADYDYIRSGIYSLLTDGYYPILAHPERYRHVCGAEYGIDDLLEMGCYMQINASSIMGDSGIGARRFAKKLLKQRRVHFVATDAHDLWGRPPRLSDCADYIRKKYGEDYSKKLFMENPLCVIRDEEIVLN